MEININEVKRKERKTVKLNLSTYPSYSRFMKKENISPNRLLDKAMESLMKQVKKQRK